MIARSDAERRIRDALAEVASGFPQDIDKAAARLVDEIYGADGADATNPRYEPPEPGYEAD